MATLIFRQHVRLTIFTLACISSFSLAQKRPLTTKDFDSWRTLTGQVLSSDGHYVAYGLFPLEGDGEVIIRNLATGKETREPAGELPPPPPEDPNAEGPPPPRTIQLSFTNDSKTLVFLAYPTHAAVEKAKTDKKNPAHEELVVFDLASAKSTRVPDIKSFQLPKKSDGFVAYLKYPAPTPPTPSAENSTESEAPAARSRNATNREEFGTTLTVLNLTTQTTRELPDVLDYQITRDGKSLAYSVAAHKPEADGVFVIPTADENQTAPHELISGKAQYQHLVWTEKSDALAFIGNPSINASDKKPPYNLYLWNSTEPKATLVVSATTPGFHSGYVIHDHATLTFSKDGTRLFFGAAPPSAPRPPATIDPDKPSFDLWSYNEESIPPIQKVRATADLNRSFRAVYLIPSKKMIQLADDSLPEVVPAETGHYALGTDDRPYRPIQDYGERILDTYIVDLDTGQRTLALKRHEGQTRQSPGGKYLLTFDGKDWNAISIATGKSINLTAKLPVAFWNEEEDTPSTHAPYGIGEWTKDDKHVLLYDRYDIWQIAPDGSSAVNLTHGLGRAQHLQLRAVVFHSDPEDRTIDPAKPLLIRAEDTNTRDSGFFTSRIDAKEPPTKLLLTAEDYNNPVKARDADVYALTAQTFSKFPNLLITDVSFKNLQKISDANPQQSSLLWGTDEMVNFQSTDGIPLQGILYKPENFDPHKKYPMIVYLYEKLSQNLNHFVEPRPMDSINISYYVSNGYLVFTPDIVYTTGYPGQSALKCVLGGVNAVTALGFVDEKNIGIQGHSWGGYQIAYMVTQTTRFKAAEDGAPVVNMISAYDGIRWGSGRPRQFQYEKTQSRIGGSPWEVPLRFIDNSPIFQIDRIQTPLLILHNDADDAVPWYQGIEFFLALRRLEKPAWMFSYNGEPHHLRRRANQRDYAQRMAEFFDYELKSGPKPKWMDNPIPYLHTAEQAAP
ncbi:MAG TPA: prolyl oligopeptidase family serine peptidase [Edaphobacter sp.]|jgi:dipeptidyl aminopeptidase/acylaminoacyl peptidase|nr:prolyl oligopeptidase family serine peptidase [Edaphobacter sp.]